MSTSWWLNFDPDPLHAGLRPRYRSGVAHLRLAYQGCKPHQVMSSRMNCADARQSPYAIQTNLCWKHRCQRRFSNCQDISRALGLSLNVVAIEGFISTNQPTSLAHCRAPPMPSLPFLRPPSQKVAKPRHPCKEDGLRGKVNAKASSRHTRGLANTSQEPSKAALNLKHEQRFMRRPRQVALSFCKVGPMQRNLKGKRATTASWGPKRMNAT